LFDGSDPDDNLVSPLILFSVEIRLSSGSTTFNK